MDIFELRPTESFPEVSLAVVVLHTPLKCTSRDYN